MKGLRAAVRSVFNILIELKRTEEIPEDVVAEDTPPLLQRHIPAVGLDHVLGLLDVVGKKGGGYGEICQALRGLIACNLTESERMQFLM